MHQPWLVRTAAATSLVLTVGCRPNLRPLAPQFVIPPVSLCGERQCTDSVEITYLGVSGFLIRRGGDAIMTAPSFTHPRLWTTFFPFIPVSPDTQLVRWMMGRERLDGISAVLVGHSHYDHLMDAPFVAKMLPEAKLYGGPTMKNILWAIPSLRDRLVSLGGAAVGDRLRPGEWFPAGSARIRFMALKSNHPPNIYILGAFPYTYARGSVERPRSSLPRTPRGWKLGETYAYLIDFMGDDGRPIFRIFFQDAAGEPEHSLIPPLAPNDQRGVDVAIICAGNAEYATGYPALMLREMNPRHVIVGHWESFFRKPTPAFQAITLSNTYQLAAQLDRDKKGAWVTPQPRARVVYRF